MISCSEQNCRLIIDVRDYILLKGELLINQKELSRDIHDRKICDCIILFSIKPSQIDIAVVELKSKLSRAKDVYKKLENGCYVALSLIQQCGSTRNITGVFPIILARYTRKSEYKILRSLSKIVINNFSMIIQLGRCGSNLMSYV